MWQQRALKDLRELAPAGVFSLGLFARKYDYYLVQFSNPTGKM
jgi:hypothetical protein